ncbi:hypothetical protein [Methylobacter marinus]|uniref:hypothetical protein n=1 Tax=Methylobacter marinus TaxID=34058 RepID=UPI00035C5FED|nr:hypothetical protein [Methylobacter marinus]
MDNSTPVFFNSDLKADRLNFISRLLLDARYSALNDANTELDDNYCKGTLAFGRQRQAIIQACLKKQYPWLTVSHAGTDVIFKIGSVIVRFFTDNSRHPRKPRVLIPTVAESTQLGIFEPSSNEVVLWRFIVEKAMNDEDVDTVYFIGINEFNEIICRWTYEGSVPVLHSIDDSTPHEKELPPASVTPKFKDEKSNPKLDDVQR